MAWPWRVGPLARHVVQLFSASARCAHMLSLDHHTDARGRASTNLRCHCVLCPHFLSPKRLRPRPSGDSAYIWEQHLSRGHALYATRYVAMSRARDRSWYRSYVVMLRARLPIIAFPSSLARDRAALTLCGHEVCLCAAGSPLTRLRSGR